MVLQIPHHVKVFPPAVQNFEAGLLVIAADFAIMKRYGVAQPRATPHQFFGSIFHSGLNSLINHASLTTFHVLRLGILLENLFRLFDFIGRIFIITEIARQELLVCPEVNHTMAAEIK